MGGRMRQDLNDELEQARYDFDDQNRLEQAAEQRSKYNSQFLRGGDTVNRSMGGGQIKATTP